MLRKIFVSKRDEVTGDWRRCCIEKLHDLYFSPNIIQVITSRRMRWERRKVLVRNPEGNRLLGRPRCRGEDNIKVDF